jgi:hypothetical protein
MVFSAPFAADMAGDAAFIVVSNGRRFQRGKQTRCLFRIVQHGRPAQNRF